MEPEQPPSETSDDAKPPSAATEQQQQQPTTHVPRSYECNFCKRGFTNAQALGGHMNIHRKDKTKFKHSATTTTAAAAPANITVAEPPSTTSSRLNPNPFSISHQGKQLPLFEHDTVVQRNIHHPGGDTSAPEGGVDLELRLGHVEPPPESSSENKTTTTRKFF